MAEIAPGLHVNPDSLVSPGKAYIVDASFVNPQADPPKWLVMAQSDWDRLDPAEREQLADTITRENAEAGQDRLERWLEDRDA
jgi:hypothetical protein